MKIIFDMDGTIADLYGVENWCEKLRAEDATPYAEARPLVNMQSLARVLNRLTRLGYDIVVVSWLSKNSTDEFERIVAEVKNKWLNEHLKSVEFAEKIFTKYGTPKENYSSGYDILFDDNEKIRKQFETKGENVAYDATNIIEILKKLK